MESRKYEAIDGLRTFSCLGIIAMHLWGNGQFIFPGFFFNRIVLSFTNLVFLFMVISAFGMCCGYYEKMISGRIDIISFYRKRYLRILPFFALLCVLDLIISPSITALYEVFVNLTLCFGFIPNADISVIGVAWFLGVVFAFYIVFPFFCFLIASKRKAWFSFVVSVILHYICAFYFGADRKAITFCFCFFVAGGLIFLYKDRLENKIAKWISIIVFLVSCLFYYIVKESLISMLLIFTSLLIIAIASKEKGILNNSFTKFIGGISFEIYLCHMMIYRVFEKIKIRTLTDNDYVNFILLYIAVIVCAAVFSFICQKKINGFIGKRVNKND